MFYLPYFTSLLQRSGRENSQTFCSNFMLLTKDPWFGHKVLGEDNWLPWATTRPTHSSTGNCAGYRVKRVESQSLQWKLLYPDSSRLALSPFHNRGRDGGSHPPTVTLWVRSKAGKSSHGSSCQVRGSKNPTTKMKPREQAKSQGMCGPSWSQYSAAAAVRHRFIK